MGTLLVAGLVSLSFSLVSSPCSLQHIPCLLNTRIGHGLTVMGKSRSMAEHTGDRSGDCFSDCMTERCSYLDRSLLSCRRTSRLELILSVLLEGDRYCRGVFDDTAALVFFFSSVRWPAALSLRTHNSFSNHLPLVHCARSNAGIRTVHSCQSGTLFHTCMNLLLPMASSAISIWLAGIESHSHKGSSQKFFVVPETNRIHLGGGDASQNRKSTDTVHMTCTCMRFSSSSIASCVRFRGRGGGPSTK